MARSARCARCDINYPYDVPKCPICGVDTFENAGEDYTTGWRRIVEEVNSRWVIGKPLPDITQGKVIKFKDKLFVADDLLRRYGYHDVAVDSIILIGGVYYEVDGSINDDEAPGWWITEVDLSKDFSGLETLTLHEYTELQRQRLR